MELVRLMGRNGVRIMEVPKKFSPYEELRGNV